MLERGLLEKAEERREEGEREKEREERRGSSFSQRVLQRLLGSERDQYAWLRPLNQAARNKSRNMEEGKQKPEHP